MRWSMVAFVLLVLPLPAGAQEVALPLADPTGDVSTSAADLNLPASPWTTIDLVGLAWNETPEALEIELTVDDLEAPRERVFIVDSVSYAVHFTFGHDYFVTFSRSPFVDDIFYGAALFQNATGGSAFVQGLDVFVDAARGVLSTTVPKELITDLDGKILGLGDSIEGIHVTSRAGGFQILAATGPSTPKGTDRMPDNGAASWAVQHGIEQSGHVSLASPRPTRASNGEATTFIYELTVANEADVPDTVRLAGSRLPDNWVATFPQERIRMDANSEVQVPVLITVPFAHNHGSYQSLLVEAQSQSDPAAVGRIELGVRYAAVPQPAGHHDTVWLHGSASGLYINTMEDHAGDSGEPVTITGEGGNLVTTTYSWSAPLLPGLQMGLDFDLDREGELTITAEMPGGGLGATVHGELLLQRGTQDFFLSSGDDLPLATYASQPVDFLPGDIHSFTMPLIPLADADWVPLEPDSNLVLRIELTATTPFGMSFTPAGPSIHPGTPMRLPLNEFHDKVSGYFSTLSGLDLWAPEGQERLANPGRTAVFTVQAKNLGDEAATYDLRLTGTPEGWARVLEAGQVRLGAGEERTLHVAVDIPDGAADGERADVTLHAERSGDANVRSLVRFVVEVDTEADHPDERALADMLQGQMQDKKSPAGWFWGVAGLVAVALARRGRP